MSTSTSGGGVASSDQPSNVKRRSIPPTRRHGCRSSSRTTVPSGSDSTGARHNRRSAARRQSAPATQTLAGEPPVELDGRRQSIAVGERSSVGVVVGAAAVGARTVPGGEGDGLVEEEDRRPPVRVVERLSIAAELRQARDPQRAAAVVANDGAGVVDEAAAVAGEQTPGVDGVEVAPRVDAVAPRHTGVPASAAIAGGTATSLGRSARVHRCLPDRADRHVPTPSAGRRGPPARPPGRRRGSSPTSRRAARRSPSSCGSRRRTAAGPCPTSPRRGR